MEPKRIRTNANDVIIDIEIDGKDRHVAVTEDAIDEYLHLPPGSAVAWTPAKREEFVRTHLPQVIAAAKRKLGVTSETADLVMVMPGEL